MRAVGASIKQRRQVEQLRRWWIKQSMRRPHQSDQIIASVQSATKISKIHAAKIKLTEELVRAER